ncbi:MAG: GNAT family N-acetyltransferase [Pseudomonadota bacterium]
MNIELLADHTESITTLADWYVREWGPYYGVEGPGDARADLESCCNTNTIPICMVAIDGSQLLGVVALDVDVATMLTPSVVGLLVAGEFRGQGVASRLLESAVSLAEELGYPRVYISTSVLDKHLLHSGWRLFGEVRFLNDQQGSTYVRDLDSAT